MGARDGGGLAPVGQFEPRHGGNGSRKDRQRYAAVGLPYRSRRMALNRVCNPFRYVRLYAPSFERVSPSMVRLNSGVNDPNFVANPITQALSNLLEVPVGRSGVFDARGIVEYGIVAMGNRK